MAIVFLLALIITFFYETHSSSGHKHGDPHSQYEMAKEIQSLHDHAHHATHHHRLYTPFSQSHDGPQEITENVPSRVVQQFDKATCGPQLPGVNEMAKVCLETRDEQNTVGYTPSLPQKNRFIIWAISIVSQTLTTLTRL